jgi:hypothetical protein
MPPEGEMKGLWMATLAEGYIHLKPYLASRGRLIDVGELSRTAAVEIAQRVYGGNVTLQVRIEEGSAKAWFTVAAGLATAIAAYPNLRTGTIALVNDAREFGGYVNTTFLEKSRAKPEQTFRAERRTKTPGKIARVIKHLDELNETPAKPERRRLELAMVRLELEAIERDLQQEEIEVLHAGLVFENIPPLRPQPNKTGAFGPTLGLPPRETGEQTDLLEGLTFDANTRAADVPNSPVVYVKTVFVPPVGIRLTENQTLPSREIEPPLEH